MLGSIIDRIYWAVLILSPLAYAVVNLEALKRTGKRYLLYLAFLDLSLFFTSSLFFLMRSSDLIRGNVHEIRTALLAITIVRVPLHLFFYARLVKDLPAGDADDGK